jgi:diaminohydroxyphosphoribosylaminopyrimidine deaminase/5-amino-6-(5-phosphoribosylamino)uracil reductase
MARRENKSDEKFMRRALALARKGYGGTSPNPVVGAVLVKNGKIIGQGWHKRAGEPHAEINAIANALATVGPVPSPGDLRPSTGKRISFLRGATLYVTLEPCSTCGRTGPCTSAILEAGIKRVIAAAPDPNPKHSGAGFDLLRKSGVEVITGVLEEEARQLNEAFNHWIVHRTPFVLLKSAMSLDGRIATVSGESKWITGERARARGMRLRAGADAIVAGVNTIVRDDPSLTLRPVRGLKIPEWKKLRRIVLDPEGRTPPDSKVLRDEQAELTTIVITSLASARSVAGLTGRAQIIVAPRSGKGRTIDLKWLMKNLGGADVTSLLVEGGGETHAAFLEQGIGHRVCFFYAPMIIGGRAAARSVGGSQTLNERAGIRLMNPVWERLGGDLLLNAAIQW